MVTMTTGKVPRAYGMDRRYIVQDRWRCAACMDIHAHTHTPTDKTTGQEFGDMWQKMV